MATKHPKIGEKQRIEVRRGQAVEYRKLGLSYRSIASRLGVSAATIVTDVEAVMKTVRGQTAETAKELQTLQYERLEMALLAICPKMLRGEVQAVDVWRRLLDQENRLLGLNEPSKIAPQASREEPRRHSYDRKRLARLTPEQLDQFEAIMVVLMRDEDEEDDFKVL